MLGAIVVGSAPERCGGLRAWKGEGLEVSLGYNPRIRVLLSRLCSEVSLRLSHWGGRDTGRAGNDEGTGRRVRGSGFRDQGFGRRVQGVGGVGCRV